MMTECAEVGRAYVDEPVAKCDTQPRATPIVCLHTAIRGLTAAALGMMNTMSAADPSDGKSHGSPVTGDNSPTPAIVPKPARKAYAAGAKEYFASLDLCFRRGQGNVAERNKAAVKSHVARATSALN